MDAVAYRDVVLELVRSKKFINWGRRKVRVQEDMKRSGQVNVANRDDS
jgi:hypothetical protein